MIMAHGLYKESLGLSTLSECLSVCLCPRSARVRSAAKNPLVLKVNWIKTQSQCLEFFWISLQACRHPFVKCFFSSSRFLQVQSSFVAITVHTEKTETGNVQPFFLPSAIIYRCAKRSLFPVSWHHIPLWKQHRNSDWTLPIGGTDKYIHSYVHVYCALSKIK